MKNKKMVLILVLLFAALIIGASVLYDKLGNQFQMDQLSEAKPNSEKEDNTEKHDDTEKDSEDTGQADENGEEKELEKAPDFTAYDADGNPVKLSNYFGKPIVLNFWASWCGPCRSEMPEFNEKYLELKDEVVFLMVNMTDGQRETLDIAKRFLDGEDYEFPVLFDKDSEAAYLYQVYSLPTTYFLDREGNLVAQAKGAINAETLQRGIDMIK